MDSFKHISHIIRTKESPQPQPSGVSTPSDSESTVVQQLKALTFENLVSLKDVFFTGLKGKPVDDKDYLMERVIKIVSDLPVTSSSSEKLTHGFLSLLWKDLQHPPASYLGGDFIYRKADGSYNNIRWPHIGQAGVPYARTVKPETVTPIARPDPGVIFDSVLKRDTFKEHPNKISSVLFYLASIIIHDIFHTSHEDFSKSQTSSYLDLAPLYGSNQEDQDQMRTFRNGKLKADCFADKRILGFPPGVGVLLIMFNRWHNWIVGQLALIDEGGRFSNIRDKGPPAQSAARYDDALFQTGRLITGGLYINIILKDYVRTILNLNRTNSDWDLDPRSEAGKSVFGDDIPQATGNQVSAEFNLVYRWHSCVSERDEKWTQEVYAKISGGEKSKSLSDFLQRVGKWALALPTDPQARPFADLERAPDGSFKDDDVAAIFTASVEDVAGAFGAKNVPEVLRDVELLGMIQARAWNLASLNEFRKYFNLEPHKTFEDINPDPVVADALRRLYGQPDYVEIYPGIIVESAKEAIVPGSGLCTNFTISRAILSDAVALVRGDRFYTVDYTPKNLTNYGFEAANYDLAVDSGCVFYKLVLRALPQNYSHDSIYAHYPMVVPSENEEIMADLGRTDLYNFSKPTSIPKDTLVTSYAACRTVLEDRATFAMRKLARDFPNLESSPFSEKLIVESIYVKNWRQQVTDFYEEMTLDLLQRRSYPLAGVMYVDVVRDIIIPAQLQFASSVFSLPLKSEHNPGGTYGEEELFRTMANISHYMCYHTDPISSFSLRQALRNDVYRLAELLEMNIGVVDKAGFIANLAERLYKHDALTDYGVQVIQRLLKSGLDGNALVGHVLPAAAAMITQQSQSFSECLDFYLSEAGQRYWPEISRLANLNTAEADEILEKYFLEGSRINCTSTWYRSATADTKVQDKEKSFNLKSGQRVFCNLQSAFRDTKVFPDPLVVDINRDKALYTQHGFGPNRCLDEMSMIASTTMLKVIGRLKTLRRAPGPQGYLKTVEHSPSELCYMNAEQTSYLPFPTTMMLTWEGPLPRK